MSKNTWKPKFRPPTLNQRMHGPAWKRWTDKAKREFAADPETHPIPVKWKSLKI